MLVKDTKFTIDARKKQLIQQDANALKDAKLRGSCLCCVALVYPLLESRLQYTRSDYGIGIVHKCFVDLPTKDGC